MDKKILGGRIKKLREENGYKIKYVADAIGMSAANLGEAESGKLELKADNRVKLADFYCVPLDYLFREDFDLDNENFVLDKFSDFVNQLPQREKRIINEFEKVIIRHYKHKLKDDKNES